ncbi:uncharacterized protein LOC134698010 [Mytilus trossulus]|uniref:uncharacterized protein LOC134698010 n=1 Tax=Mytilus trossulus TaxID=6551 RepID=UPI003007E724
MENELTLLIIVYPSEFTGEPYDSDKEEQLPQQQTPTQRPTEPDEQCVQVFFNSGDQPIHPGSLLSVYTTVPGSLVISKNPTVGPPLLRVGELMPVHSLPIASLPVTSITADDYL